MSHASQQTTLYRVYDQAGQLLYVGISKNALKRFGEHSMSQPWWGDGTTVKMQHYPTRAEALAAEEAAIKSERPAHNKTHNGNATQATVTTYTEPTPGVDTLIQPGDVVAIRTYSDNHPPVGIASKVDNHGVRLTLYGWFGGFFNGADRIVTWDDIISVLFAEVEDEVRGVKYYAMDPLAAFQSKWTKPEAAPDDYQLRADR